MSQANIEDARHFQEAFGRLVNNVEVEVVGKRSIIELAFIAMLSRGHLLLEDVPGTGKTSLARAMGASISGTSSRIQFTPDLLPGDVTGITVYDQKERTFEFHPGPIFANVVLADEINRASPKTQSALLEVMEEGQVTVDGTSRSVGVPFLVVATQNPVEQAGTYRLPEAQLDRFLLRTALGYPDTAATMEILQRAGGARPQTRPVMDPQEVLNMIDIASRIYVAPSVADYVARLVEATRSATQVRLGASVRGALGLLGAAKTRAASRGRHYVIPDDVAALAGPVLAHRLILDPEAEFDGVTAEAVVDQILLDTVPPAQGASA